MKKFLGRIFGLISVLIFGYQQFCYADVIVSPLGGFSLFDLTFLLAFIGVIILITSAISFFSLKATIKNQSMPEYDSENLKTLSIEKIEKKKSTIQRRFYVWGMILAIIGLIYLALSEEISVIVFFIPIILFVISFSIRLKKNKKASNIICAISVIFVCIIGSWVGLSNKMIENYNKQFLQYEKSESSYRFGPKYVSDIVGFINTTIQNNKSGKNTTIVYKNTNYTSPDELRQLLSLLNTNKKYALNIKTDDNNNYIESITLTSYIPYSLNEFKKYEDYRITGREIVFLIENASANNDIKINIVYVSAAGQKTTVSLNTYSYENIAKLKDEFIKSRTYYNVEFITDLNDIVNIVITKSN